MRQVLFALAVLVVACGLMQCTPIIGNHTKLHVRDAGTFQEVELVETWQEDSDGLRHGRNVLADKATGRIVTVWIYDHGSHVATFSGDDEKTYQRK